MSKPTADYLMGYIKALEDRGGGSLHYQLHHDELFMMVPEAMPGEPQFLPQKVTKNAAYVEGVSLTESTVEALKLAITEGIEPRLRLALWQAKEEIIATIATQTSPERTKDKLVSEYGNWVDSIDSQGDLINAEFLYEALNARSWREVIVGYTTVVEAEIKARLLPQLATYLTGKGISVDSILPWEEDSRKSVLGYTARVLKKMGENSILLRLLSFLPKETLSFLLSELPNSLAHLRELRNRAVHEIVSAKDAKDTRKLVLGSPENPGLLKRLNQIAIYDE